MRNIALLLLCLPVSMWADNNDTLVVNRPQRVTVVTNDSLQKIIIHGRENDDDFVYRNSIELVDSNYVSQTTIDRERWAMIPKVPVTKNDSCKGLLVEWTVHMSAGFSVPLNQSEGLGFRTFRSAEVGIVPFQIDVTFPSNRNKWGRHTLSAGIGVNWRDFEMRNGLRMVRNEEGRVVLDNFPEGSKPHHARIDVFSLSFPILYQHRFNRGWGFAVGPVLNWNSSLHLKTGYDKDGGEYIFTDRNAAFRKFTVDYMFVLKNPFIPVYVKYSPMQLLKNTDLKFKSLSFGLYI